ncbi:MAG: DUF4932 domain-containing protein, partial [Gemmatimonadales bacterium]
MRHKATLAVLPALLWLGSCAPDVRGRQPLEIRVDPRIELIGVVQWLGGYMLTTQYNFGYRREVEEWFGNHRDHPAVGTFMEMSRGGFSFDAVPKAMLAYGSPPELSRGGEALPAGVAERAGGEARLDAFMESLSDFAVATDFQGFFDAHRATYDNIVAEADGAARSAAAILENYVGRDIQNSTLILGLLLHHGGFSVLFENATGTAAWALIGPAAIVNDQPSFGDKKRIGRIIWHEFAHTVVNELTDERSARVDALRSMHEPIAEQMTQRGYRLWHTVVNEHVIRALTIRLLAGQFGAEMAGTALESDVNIGFAYLPPLVDALQYYETHRTEYRTLADYYDVVIDSLAAQEGRSDSR